jgi:hypothetical protein
MIISPMVLIFAGGIIGGSMAARPAHAAEANSNATKLNRSPFVGKQKSWFFRRRFHYFEMRRQISASIVRLKLEMFYTRILFLGSTCGACEMSESKV